MKEKPDQPESHHFGGLMRLAPDPHSTHGEGWKFVDAQAGPATPIRDVLECASTISVAAEVDTGGSVDDGLRRGDIRPGDVWLSSGGQVQSLTFCENFHLNTLVIERSYMLRLTEGMVDSLPCVFRPSLQVRDLEIHQSMLDLRKYVLRRGGIGRLYCEAYASLIALRALGRSGWIPLHTPDYKDPLPGSTIKTVLDYMYAHAGDSCLHATNLAELVGLPVDVFRHRFRRSFGRSVYQSLLDVRMEVAAHQLRAASRSVGQIAMDTGFADHSHFTKVFRNRVGMTPSEFREATRSGRLLSSGDAGTRAS